MAREKKPPPGAAGSAPLTSNPFAGLRDKLGVPAAPAPSPEKEQPAATARAPAAPLKGPARAVVRLERKGRGGKDVTLVEKLDVSAPELEAWLKDLKRALGTGGVIEDGSLVLQGDHRDRLPALLEARGVRKVTLGS